MKIFDMEIYVFKRKSLSERVLTRVVSSSERSGEQKILRRKLSGEELNQRMERIVVAYNRSHDVKVFNEQ